MTEYYYNLLARSTEDQYAMYMQLASDKCEKCLLQIIVAYSNFWNYKLGNDAAHGSPAARTSFSKVNRSDRFINDL